MLLVTHSSLLNPRFPYLLFCITVFDNCRVIFPPAKLIKQLVAFIAVLYQTFHPFHPLPQLIGPGNHFVHSPKVPKIFNIWNILDLTKWDKYVVWVPAKPCQLPVFFLISAPFVLIFPLCMSVRHYYSGTTRFGSRCCLEWVRVAAEQVVVEKLTRPSLKWKILNRARMLYFLVSLISFSSFASTETFGASIPEHLNKICSNWEGLSKNIKPWVGRL